MDKDESTKSGNDVDASQASLNQEIGGKKRSLSQKFATLNNGIIDVNTNLHIFDSTQKKEEEEEQHRSVLGNQHQQSKRENESHLLHNSPPQYHSPRHYLEESNLQSRNNPFSNEPQKMSSSQYDHGVEQPLNHGSKVVDITEFLRFLIARVDADRKSQLRFLFYKFKRIEITREDFIRRLRRVVGDEMARYAINNVSHLQQVNLPSPSGTIPAGANVRTIPKMPFVGRKKPLESLGSLLPPSSKKQKLCGTSLHQSIEQLNDVTALSGINLREEEERLLFSGSKKGGRVSEASQRVAHEEDVRTILQRAPLQRKMKEIMAKSGLKHINDDVELCLSRCVEERLHGLLSNAIQVSKQRTDAEKCRKRTCITSDIRKQIYEMNQKAKEEWESKHCGVEKLKSEDNETARKVTRLEQVKANKEQERAKAANVAVRAAVGGGGGDDTFLKWKRMVEEARQKPSSRPRINSMRPCAETGGRRFEKNQGSTKVARTITVEDVIAVLEKEQQMSRSTLLYRLYNRICSDVGRQDKT